VVRPLFVETGNLRENGFIESFNGKLRDELINREVFATLLEAKSLIKTWRREYNQVSPHNSIGYWAPAPQTIQLQAAVSAARALTQEVVS